MNLKGLKFEFHDNSSLIWEEWACERQNVQKFALYKGIPIYVRYENYAREKGKWLTSKTSYSLDKKIWYHDLISIQRDLKEMGF